MAELTKGQLATQNSNSFPNNNAGLITPILLRTFNSDMIDSLVDEISYTADSASFDARIDAIPTTNTGSLLTTASFNNGTRNLTFTKGDSSTFSVNIPDVSGSTGNFATTGSNTFVGDQRISGSIFFPNGTEIRGNASSQTILFSPTSSLLLRSAVNTVVSGSSVSIQGLLYPNFDGTAGQVITTNGNGNLSFTSVAGGSTFPFSGSAVITGSLLISGSQVVTGPLTASRLQINGVTDLNGVLDVANDATFRTDIFLLSSSPKLKFRNTTGAGRGFDVLVNTASFVIYDDTHDINFFDFDYDGVDKHTLRLEANEFQLNSGSVLIEKDITSQIFLTPQTLTGPLVVPSGSNGMLTGPVSNSGIITIELGSTLVIL